MKIYFEYFGEKWCKVLIINNNFILLDLKNTKRPGLQQLIKKLNFDGKDLTSSDVGIRIAPKLNALSRMDSEILPIHIYIEKSSADAEQLVEKMFDSNQDRLDLQSFAETRAEELLSAQDHTPFEGFVAKGWSTQTIIRGRVMFDNGRVTEEKHGEFIKRPTALRDW